MQKTKNFGVATQVLARSWPQIGRAAFILALSAIGSATAICAAFSLIWVGPAAAPAALSSALVGCVALSAGSLAAGWWAADRLVD